MARILLIRHGKTKLSKEERFWGKTDVPLSAVGIKQATQLGKRLAEEKITTIYSSAQTRARFTAEIIAAPHKVEVKPLPELNECNFGFIEGLTFKEIYRLYPDVAEGLKNREAVAFPGGESLDDLNKRVEQFLKRLSVHKEQDTVAVVAHGGPLRLLVCHLMGFELILWRQLRLDLASLSIIETFPGSNFLTLFNDTCHL
jgi:broad specificity phosphatase PhoE